MLTDGIISKKEAKRFLELTQNLKKLSSRDIQKLNIEVNFLSNSAKSKLEKSGSSIKIINK